MINNDKALQGQTFINDVRTIIEQGRKTAYAAAGQTAIVTFWNVGRRIVEEEQNGESRASYGSRLIKNLSEELMPVYGRSYSKRNLDYYKKFYLIFPDIEIVNTRVHNLQLDMYVRMYDDLMRSEDDQPTIGVLLCTDTDKTIARYSVLHDSDQLYAAKYMTYMPTEEELRREIEQQKQFFLEQQKNKEEEA